MTPQRWTAQQCAAHVGTTTSTWRDYVADYRAPAPLPGYDPDTGRKTWDPDTVRTWHASRPGQGARTDLTYLPDPTGQPVFLNGDRSDPGEGQPPERPVIFRRRQERISASVVVSR